MKKIISVILSIALILVLTIPAFAETEKNYKINDCGWRTDNGKVEAFWDNTESSTKFRVIVYRQTGTGSKKAVYKETTGAHSLYVSPIIASYGTGKYYFDVYPVKGDESDKASSDDMEVDSTYLNIICNQVKSDIKDVSNASQQPQYVWNKCPDGSWQLRKDGCLVTNQWVQLDGYWYLFGSNGNMLKGWQQKDGKMYYLNETAGAAGYPEGACFMNTVTPDGRRVDASGALIQ